MLPEQLNTLCSAYANVDKVSLHTADPGYDGSNDSGITHVSITWSSPSGGQMWALAEFSNVTGSFTHVGLWDDTVFVEGQARQIVNLDDQTLKVLIVHKVTA